MTKLNLLTELLETANNLLETNMTSLTLYQARTQIAYTFDRFEEHSDRPTCNLITTINEIATEALATMSTALAEYFNTIQGFISDNEIHPHNHTVEQAQLMVGFYNIFNELLQTEITPCDAHHAYVQLDDLLKDFELQAEENEDKAVDYNDDTPNALSHFFPNMQEALGELTLFPA